MTMPISNPDVAVAFGHPSWTFFPTGSSIFAGYRSVYKLKRNKIKTWHLNACHSYLFKQLHIPWSPLSSRYQCIFFAAITGLHWWRKQNTIRVIQENLLFFHCGSEKRGLAFSLWLMCFLDLRSNTNLSWFRGKVLSKSMSFLLRIQRALIFSHNF